MQAEKKGKDEIPVGAGDSKDILRESDKGYREDREGERKRRTRNKLTETRRKVTA
jgi:ribosomal protein S6E (S10)